ncbi:unnamed protein product [Cylicocyclus nassatus]|uniref:MRG domain-containing protein n=1 Tax=Cylicocyclus nassatus TaxID=53992 RepID=A0AA36H5U2_CYLNA|nr:unnamed protein product [Cylicocyclus nassatus]
MGKNHDEAELPILGQMRRQLKRGLRRYLYTAAAILLLILMYRWLIRKSDGRSIYGYKAELMTPKASEPKLNSVKLDIYLASQCPDTTRFIRTQLMKAWSLLSHTHRVELTLVPFGKARCVSRGEDFECSCQHGANECILNQLMNCVIDRIGFPEKTVPIVNCIQGRWSFDDAMSSCIDSNPLLNHHQMRDCATGARGRRLLALAGAQTAALRPSLDFVPWVMINDAELESAKIVKKRKSSKANADAVSRESVASASPLVAPRRVDKAPKLTVSSLSEDAKSVEFHYTNLPKSLREILKKDQDAVLQRRLLAKLPVVYPIDFLSTFDMELEWAGDKLTVSHGDEISSSRVSALIRSCQMITDYFNMIFGNLLLYHPERDQYQSELLRLRLTLSGDGGSRRRPYFGYLIALPQIYPRTPETSCSESDVIGFRLVCRREPGEVF